MSASGTPIMKYLSVSAGGTGTINFGQDVGCVWVRCVGPNSAFMAIGAVAPTPSAGDGRVEAKPNQPIKWKDVSLQKLSFSCAALESAEVEAIGYPVLASR